MIYRNLNSFSTSNGKKNHIKVLTLPNTNSVLINYIKFCISIKSYVNKK